MRDEFLHIEKMVIGLKTIAIPIIADKAIFSN